MTLTSSVSALCRDAVDAQVRDLLGSAIGDDTSEMHAEVPFMEAGLDSLSAVEFRNSLQERLHINLPATFSFDYPTIRDIVEYLAPSHQPSAAEDAPAPHTRLAHSTVSQRACEIIGLSSRLAGMSSEEILPSVMQGIDTVTPSTLDLASLGLPLGTSDNHGVHSTLHGTFLE